MSSLNSVIERNEKITPEENVEFPPSRKRKDEFQREFLSQRLLENSEDEFQRKLLSQRLLENSEDEFSQKLAYIRANTKFITSEDEKYVKIGETRIPLQLDTSKELSDEVKTFITARMALDDYKGFSKIRVDSGGRVFVQQRENLELSEEASKLLDKATSNISGVVTNIMRQNDLVIVGEAHDFNGRYLSKEIVNAAAAGGAKVIFLEVSKKDQAILDEFSKTGNTSILEKIGVGGHIYGKPLVDALVAARNKGMKIIATDDLDLGLDVESRNRIAADTISDYQNKNNGAKGLYIVGQAHIEDKFSTGTDKLLRDRGLEVADIGRSQAGYMFGNDWFADNAYAGGAETDSPKIIDTRSIPGKITDPRDKENSLANNYSYVIVYPYQKAPDR
jgi:hypothetical protein